MIARATLALMLACPTATVALCPHGAAAHPASPIVSKREKTSAPNRRSRSAARPSVRRDAPIVSSLYPGPTVSALFPGPEDSGSGAVQTTPRGPDGRPVALAVAARPIPLARGLHVQFGVASWYGGKRWQGHLTSNGTRYDENKLTAAHATLPLGSQVRVRLVGTDREVVVTITDRPGTRRRIIDLSRAAAAALGILSRGVAEVSLEPI